MLTLVRLGWGQENPAFRQLFTSQFIPGGTKEQTDWFNELQRISTSPEDAVRNLIANGDTDVRIAAIPRLSPLPLSCMRATMLAYRLIKAGGSPQEFPERNSCRSQAAITSS